MKTSVSSIRYSVSTVIPFLLVRGKFGTCTVVSVNGTFVEEKYVDSRMNVHILASLSHLHSQRCK
jgi:hypothetical protein